MLCVIVMNCEYFKSFVTLFKSVPKQMIRGTKIFLKSKKKHFFVIVKIDTITILKRALI